MTRVIDDLPRALSTEEKLSIEKQTLAALLIYGRADVGSWTLQTKTAPGAARIELRRGALVLRSEPLLNVMAVLSDLLYRLQTERHGGNVPPSAPRAA